MFEWIQILTSKDAENKAKLTMSVFCDDGFLSLLATTRNETSTGEWQWLILAETSTWCPPNTIGHCAKSPSNVQPVKGEKESENT